MYDPASQSYLYDRALNAFYLSWGISGKALAEACRPFISDQLYQSALSDPNMWFSPQCDNISVFLQKVQCRYKAKTSGVVALVGGAVLHASYRTPQMLPNTASLGGVSLRIDYATTNAERERGLNGRENVPYDYAMLFIFPIEGKYGFWMKDMLVPIDIFWLDDKGRIISIESEVATSTYPKVFYRRTGDVCPRNGRRIRRGHNIATGTPFVLKTVYKVCRTLRNSTIHRDILARQSYNTYTTQPSSLYGLESQARAIIP